MKQTTATAAKPQTSQDAGALPPRVVTIPVAQHTRKITEHSAADTSNAYTCRVCGAFPNEPCLTSRERISDWLRNLDSHAVYGSQALRLSLQRRTGHSAPNWPEYTGAEVNRMIRGRGLGGTLVDETKNVMNANGWEVAERLAQTFAPNETVSAQVQGRGSRFRLCIAALERAGM